MTAPDVGWHGSHPDAALLTAIAEFDDLERRYDLVMEDAVDLEDEQRKDLLAARLNLARVAAAELVCSIRAKTFHGIQARARSFLSWDREITETLAVDRPEDCLHNRMIAAILRDVTMSNDAPGRDGELMAVSTLADIAGSG